MKIKIIIFLFSILLLIDINLLKRKKKKNKEIDLEELDKKFEEEEKNMPPPSLKHKFITFKINKSKWNDLDHFSRILSDFFLTANIKMQIVNMEDNELLGICDENTNINKEETLENFKGTIESIDINN